MRHGRKCFVKHPWKLENIPPTQDALNVHVMAAASQSGIWTKSCILNPEIPSPSS